MHHLKKPVCTHLLLTDLKHMEGKSASCCQVRQMALTSVVVFDLFICCRENKKKKRLGVRRRFKEGTVYTKKEGIGV